MGKLGMINSRMKKYSNSYVEDAFYDLDTSANGLKLDQIEHMRKEYGSNVISKNKTDTILNRLRRAFVNPFTVILFVIAVVSYITDVFISDLQSKNFTTVFVIFIMILLSGSIRFFQEIRSKKASDKFQRLVNADVKIKRDGVIINTTADQLVVGDYILLSAGDRIPADLRISKATDLFVSQAAITGESNISEKNSDKCEYQEYMSLSEYDNLAFMGTVIISGKGEGIVLAVGEDTLYGGCADKVANKRTRFEQGANSIARVMLRFMAVLIPIVFVVSGITKGNWIESFLFALSVAVGLTPEMLPMVITACLARGSLSMSKKQTLIKNINAMQVFGCMDILCADKTGTLTSEDILLEYYMDILGNESSDVLDLGYLNSLYHSGVRNPIDEAILKCKSMQDKKIHFENLENNHQKLDEIPFDYERKYVSTFVSDKNDNNLLIIKGDIDEVFSRCSYIEFNGEKIPIDEDSKSNVDAVVLDMLQDGMKVIAVAKKVLDKDHDFYQSDENDLTLVGYLAFFDAPKKSAAQSIEKLKNLNVSTKILTGDNADVAVSVCKRVGIDYKNILTGAQLEKMSDSDLMFAVEEVDVFAELSPTQKASILSALRYNGHTVGFLGDGINDIPAISEADVGISVDTAADAAKDAADVVLLEKDLNVLEEGILEGRKTFVNMSKYIKITASSNFGNIFSIVIASAFLPFLPITAVQILFLNLLYDILCIVLPWDKVDEEECAVSKEWSGRSLGRFMMFFGPISSVFDIITFAFLYFVLCPQFCGGLLFTQITDADMKLKYIALFQTGWFLESMWTQIMIIHMLRTKNTPFIKSRASAAVEFITVLGIVVFTTLTFSSSARLLGLTKLPLWYFIFLFTVVVLYLLSTTIVKKIYIKKYHELI